jgi:excisionase family DNA binding protein
MAATRIDPLLVPVAEAASILSISARTMWGLVAARAVPSVRIGRRTLIPVEALRDLASSARAPGHRDCPAEAERTGDTAAADGQQKDGDRQMLVRRAARCPGLSSRSVP